MRFFLVIALLAVWSPAGQAADLQLSEITPPGELRLLKTLPGYTDVAVYRVGNPENQNSYRQGDTYLQFTTNGKTWWVQSSSSSSEIDALGFAEGPYLLVGLRSAAGASTSVLNIDTRESTFLGLGIGELVRSGPNTGLIRLSGQYAYDNEGRYWYSSIVDLAGRVIAFDSEGDICLPVSELTRHGGDFSLLQQSPDSCVGATR